jgi:choline dehydrogenase
MILSAGAINTPQLLQVSGVGPGALLQRLGVEMVHASPGVGENLQDHLQVRCVFHCKKPITFNDDMAALHRTLWTGLRYLTQRKGPLTVSAGYAGGFFRTDPQLVTPNIQVHFINFSLNKMGEKLDPFSGFTASSCHLQPESRGWVRATSPDMAVPPAILANYLDTDLDRASNIAGVRLMRRIMGQPAMNPYVASESLPGAAVESDDQILAYIRANGGSIYHPTCSARMGVDPGAVVDPRLKVIGVEGLRIADGSVMPNVVSGNSNAAIIMIGEKAADMILQDAVAAPARAAA